MQTGRQAPQYPIESVDRALKLLLMFEDHGDLRLTDVRESLGVGQSTAHRLMAMLVFHGLAVQNPATRAYQVGPALVSIGLAAVARMDLRSTARPFIEALAAKTAETVHLGVVEDDGVRFVDCVESEHALRVSSRTGRLVALHATSMGKAMLAAMTDQELIRILPSEELQPVTPRTTRSRSALIEEIRRSREQGYAMSFEESEDGVCSVGVALVHPVRGLVGGLSVAAPRSRFNVAQLDALATTIRRTADRVIQAIA